MHRSIIRRASARPTLPTLAKLPLPPAANVKLKDPKAFTLIGTRAKRVDSSIKVDGRALYGIDTRLPGMKVAAVAISPVLGGKAKTVDEKAALAVKGVRQVVNIDEAVAVVADHMAAKVPTSDTGIATIGMIAGRQPCRNTSTTTTTSAIAS